VFKVVKFVLVVLFLIVGAAFAIINDQPVELDLYFLIARLPLSLLLLLAMGSGIFLGAIVSAFYFMRLRQENAHLRRQNRLAGKDAGGLPKVPLSGH